jgi:MOSC domain-containing protein YiiM
VSECVVHSINVGRPRHFTFRGREITSAIFKEPVAGRVMIRAINVDGDDQADRTVHGGVDKAVYAYASEDYTWWESRLDRPLTPGTFGENITTRGVRISEAAIGERWRVGNGLLEVSEPRIPCYKLAARMDDPEFVRTFAAALRPGAYLRIIEPGAAASGDRIEVIAPPSSHLTVRDVAQIFLFDRTRAGELLDQPSLGDGWRDWAARELGR